MSITLNELLTWRDRLSDQTSEQASMLRTLIENRETELRSAIAQMIATVSQRENWKLQRCAATARRVEETTAERLESVYEYFHDRSLGRAERELPGYVETPQSHAVAVRAPVAASPLIEAKGVSKSLTNLDSAPIIALYGRMRSLESLVAPTPGIGCGVQGIRIMRMVALMSKARSARLAQMRISGTQFIYRHM
jgi:hypothetical protein